MVNGEWSVVSQRIQYSPFTTHLSPKLSAMLKYIKNYAATIKDIDIYPIFSLVVFVLFFITMLYLVKKMDKKRADAMRNMPLDLDADTTNRLNTVKQA